MLLEEPHLLKDVRHYENCGAWLSLQCLLDKSRLKQTEFKPEWLVSMDVSLQTKTRTKYHNLAQLPQQVSETAMSEIILNWPILMFLTGWEVGGTLGNLTPDWHWRPELIMTDKAGPGLSWLPL